MAICMRCGADVRRVQGVVHGRAGAIDYDLEKGVQHKLVCTAAKRPQTKRCPTCEETKPAHMFYPDPSRGDGIDGACRACKNWARKLRKTFGASVHA